MSSWIDNKPAIGSYLPSEKQRRKTFSCTYRRCSKAYGVNMPVSRLLQTNHGNLSKIRRQICNWNAAHNLNSSTKPISNQVVSTSSLPLLSLRNIFVICLVVWLLCTLKSAHAEDGLVDILQLTPEFRRADGLYPSVVNLASRARITANATCGLSGSVKYCKLVEHVDRRPSRRGRQCSICDAFSRIPRENHSIQHAIDGVGNRWWQSPTIEHGYQYNWVTITLDLKQMFQVAYVIVKAANSPRPGNWILEKSVDGVTWYPWQYFAISNSECFNFYGLRPAGEGAPKYRTDSEVMCTSYFSQLIPLENGEIHVSLIKGRPSADNPTRELIDFTSARYVRLRLQKIRTLHGDLMTLSPSFAAYADPTVTRRYYYSIKDISIGGMCICYGHASTCPSDARTGLFSCECEHNTEGSNCERCKPGFNQYAWKPGNYGFQCEACNCHGHSEECFYDHQVDERGESLDIRGDYLGGGVCVGCRDRTDGINCETCIDGYFRPLYVEPEAPNPCLPCNCNQFGGIRVPTESGPLVCVKDITLVNIDSDLLPGSCYCKDGYTGQKCDRCEFGYRGFPQCEPCPCNVAGSLNRDPCFGECVCKENVEGHRCDQCKSGHYNLHLSNPNGCEKCFCFGVAETCQSTNLTWANVHTNEGWEVRDRYGRRKSNAEIDQELGEPYVEHRQAAREIGSNVYYWSAPEKYLGKRLNSYGGNLRYIVSYDILQGTRAYPIQEADVILQGNGKTLIYNSPGIRVEPSVETEVNLSLKPGEDSDGWVESETRQPISKEDMMVVLRDVRRLLIRAVYSRNNGAIYRIRDVYLDTAVRSKTGPKAESVESCNCPPGYVGSSCENCANGYWRNGKYCVRCKCNDHSNDCNSLSGACENCQHNTMGMHCERCKPGHYGDATWGTPNDCQRCSCPLRISSNNFSPTCRLDRSSGNITCLQCPIGYKGKKCEICEVGYFGAPSTPGGSCQPCQCNGNSNICDGVSGDCISCQGHTAGDHCERCEAAYYGDPILRKNCRPCDCNAIGSLSRQCDAITGQCTCTRDVHGRRCDACTVNSIDNTNKYLNEEAGMCVSCNCDRTGSLTLQCNFDGSCVCRRGVQGHLCDSCGSGYFGFSSTGCTECDCTHTNGNCDPISGMCICPPNTEGSNCQQCVEGSYQWHPLAGCKNCDCIERNSLSTTCDRVTGQCLCAGQYGGQRCDSCRDGYYGYPNCQPCSCNSVGAEPNTCSDTNACNCSNDGQCFCKANVVGKQCSQCADGTFSLSDNRLECITCYCSGVTHECTQAAYVWGPQVSLNADPTEVTNQIETVPTTEEVVFSQGVVSSNSDIVRPSFRFQPYYWRLPSQFNGDKLLSYGGRLQFTIRYLSEMSFRPGISSGANVVLRGGTGDHITVEYKSEDPPIGQNKAYTIRMQEHGWNYIDSEKNVSRYDFIKILQNVEFFLIKASYGSLMDQSRLSDVFLDVAQPGISGRGDAGSEFPVARGLEECFCPIGYIGLSCEECANGYMRVQQGPNIGKCEPCNCYNRSNTCEMNTGRCLNCADKFTGHNCELCLPGYYLVEGKCLKCACPGTDAGNSFSPTCYADGADGVTDFTCNACRAGYVGKHCEICADGYYGNPTLRGGYCARCSCNVAGSLDGLCDKMTGQCHCDVGIEGRVCDRCQPRHVITQDGCTECQDGCTGKLLDEVESLVNLTKHVDIRDVFPPPWNRLIEAKNITSQFQEDLLNSSKIIMDSLIDVMSLPRNVSFIRNKMTPLMNLGDQCLTNESALSTDMKATAKKLKSEKRKFRNIFNQVEGFRRSTGRLLTQLINGTTVNTEELNTDVLMWIEDIKGRKVARFLRVAKREAKLAKILLGKIHRNFSAQGNHTQNWLGKSQDDLSEEYNVLMQKLNNLAMKLMEASAMVNMTNQMKELNNQSVRQTTSTIDRISNEVIMTKVIFGTAEKTLSRASKLYEEGRSQMDTLSSEDLIKSSLKNVTEELNRVLGITSHNLEYLMMKVKEGAEVHKMELEHLAAYISQVQENVSAISYNQTQAAFRWTNIERAFSRADKSAMRALNKANDATARATTALRKRVRDSFRDAVQVSRSINIMPLAINGDRDLLGNLNAAMRSVNQSTRNLSQKHERILTSIKNIRRSKALKPAEVTEAAEESLRLVNRLDQNLGDITRKYRRLGKIEGQVEEYPKKLRNINNDFASVPKGLKKASDTFERANSKLVALRELSKTMRKNITNIRNLIASSKQKVAAIRSVSVKSTGRCAMRYKPLLTAGKTTEILLNVQTTEPNNSLFYLARRKQDYIAVELRNRLVSVSWDLGGGKGFLRNPLIVQSHIGPTQTEPDWFRIEISRRSQEMRVTVYRLSDKAGTIRSVTGTAPGRFTSLDINADDMLFVGGIVNTTEVHDAVKYRTFTGCMGEALLQGKSVGLWNFDEISNVDDCKGCAPSKIVDEEEQRSNVYSYSGPSYSILKLPSAYRPTYLHISITFQSFSSEGMLFYLGASERPDFLSLELNDGRLVLKLDLGNGMHSVKTEAPYNGNEWITATVQRYLKNARLTVKKMGKIHERLWLNSTTESDGNIDLSSHDVISVGGFPSERVRRDYFGFIVRGNVTNVSFNGCFREFSFGNNELSLKGTGSGGVIRESGVSRSCPSQIYHDIGISQGGHVELHPINLTPSGSISMTFNTRESEALLLLATNNENGMKKRRRRRSVEKFYTVYLSGGRVHATVCLSPHQMVNLSSRYNYYDNGRAHLVTLKRNGANVTLQLGENSDEVSAMLPSSSEAIVTVRRMFVGGIPESYQASKAAIVKNSLNGCLRDLLADDLMNFKDAVNVTQSHLGTCAYVEFAPLPSATLTPPSIVGSSPANFSPTISSSPPLDEYLGWDIKGSTPPPEPDDPLCQPQTLSGFRKSAMRFGANSNSHVQFELKKKISKKFNFELKVRTFGSNGLLLYASHKSQGDFFALRLKEGFPLFQFDNGKGVVEAVSPYSINDGSWHKIRIRRVKRKGYLMVDKKRIKLRSAKGANQMDVANILYVGGIPAGLEGGERVGKINRSMDICIRNLALNRRNKLELSSASSAYQVQECYKNVESGAYFDGSGYVTHSKNYRVGPSMIIEMDFRTTRSEGILLSVDSKRGDGLAIEIVNGTIYFRTDNGAGSFETFYISRRTAGTYSLCNGRWHTLRAEKKMNTLSLTVDDVEALRVQSVGDTFSADTRDPLFIGGIPDKAPVQKQLRTSRNFEGCIRNLRLKDKERLFNFEEAAVRYNVFPSSCPVSKRKKSRRS